MKKHLLFLLLNWLRSKPEAKKKLKIFIILGFVGFVFTSGFVVWVGFSAYEMAKQQVQSIKVEHSLRQVETAIKTMPEFNSPACWNKVQEFLTVEPWLMKPLFENWQVIKDACTGSKNT